MTMTKGFTRWAGLILAISLPLISTQAHAVTVTVGGTAYELGSTSTSYDSIPGILQSQPWWGSGSAALDFANALKATGSTFAVGYQYFAYAAGGGNTLTAYFDSAASSPNTGFLRIQEESYEVFVTATLSPSSVVQIKCFLCTFGIDSYVKPSIPSTCYDLHA